jgi:polar amino acid transport system permease protein
MAHLPIESLIYITKGMIVTLEYTIIALVGGSLLGTLLALLRYNNVGNFAILLYISFIRGTPLLVQLALIYFVLPSMIGSSISVFTAGAIAFSINSSAYIAEIVRSGLNNVDRGQFEASIALGIPKFLMWRDIIFPQALKSVLPALINEAVSLTKETALISTLGGEDIMRRAQMVGAEHYTYLEPLCIAAGCYYLLTLSIEQLGRKLEKGLCYDLSTKSI